MASVAGWMIFVGLLVIILSNRTATIYSGAAITIVAFIVMAIYGV
jgi:uncharacterized membrane protein YobD (UPF0266 family)